MGYHGAEPDAATRHETAEIISEVRQWLRPQFCYLVVRELPAFDMGKIIVRQLRGSEAYALFVCTSGVEYETYQQRLKQEGDMVRIFIADAFGDCREVCRPDGTGASGEHRQARMAPYKPLLARLLWLACQSTATAVSVFPRSNVWRYADRLVADGSHQER